MTIKRNLCHWALVLLLGCITPVYSTAQTLDEAISKLNGAISSAKAKKSSLAQILKGLLELIQNLASKISATNSQIESVKSDITLLEKKIETVKSESNNYLSEEADHKETTVQQKDRIQSELASIAQLLVDISEAEADLAIEQEKLSGLTDLFNRVSALQIELANSAQSVDALSQTYTEALSSHEQWLSQFNSHVLNHKPDFNSIYGANEFKDVIFDISQFQNNSPSMAKVRAKESLLRTQAANSSATIIDISLRIQDLFSNMGAGYLKSINVDEISSISKTLHVEVNELALLIQFYDNSIDEHAYSRNRMIDHTSVAWTRLAEKYLMARNATNANSIIEDIQIALNDNTTYAIIRSTIEDRRMKYKKLYRNFSSPRLARRQAMVVKGIIKTNLDSLNDLNVSYSTRTEIQAMLFDYRNYVEADLVDIAGDIVSEDTALDKRNYIVENYLARYPDKFSQTCHEIGNGLLENPETSVTHEKAYVEFREGCF